MAMVGGRIRCCSKVEPAPGDERSPVIGVQAQLTPTRVQPGSSGETTVRL